MAMTFMFGEVECGRFGERSPVGKLGGLGGSGPPNMHGKSEVKGTDKLLEEREIIILLATHLKIC